MVKTVAQGHRSLVGHHFGADPGQWTGLRRGAIPHRNRVSRLDQAGGHGLSRAAEPDPADIV
jgi:hypothetical protein